MKKYPGPSTSVVGSKSSRSQSTRNTKSEDMVVTLVVIPPDGGWGWVIVFASFIINFILDGSIYSFGLFLNDIGKSLDTLPTKVSYAASLMTGMNLLTAPIVCGLTNKYGFRMIAIIGGFLSMLAYFWSGKVKNLYSFISIYGLVGGFGGAMIYVPSIVIVGFYFERWRALATCIALCGSAVGIIFAPMILNKALIEWNWRSKFHFISAGFIIITMCALTFRPLKSQGISRTREEEEAAANAQFVGIPSSKVSSMFSYYHGLTHPVIHDLPETSPTINQGFRKIPSETSVQIASTRMSTLYEDVMFDDDDDEYDDLSEKPEKTCCYYCCCRCCKCCSRKKTISRPMYRDDIFYAGSVYTLPEYQKSMQLSMARSVTSKKSAITYHISVSRVATVKDIMEEEKCCICCPQAFTRIVATMLDFKLLTITPFLFFTLSNFCAGLGMYIPFIYITERAKEKKVRPELVSMLITGLGVSNLFGRLLSGFISSIPKVNTVILTYVSLFLCGAPTVAFAFATEEWMYYVFMAIYGLTVATAPVIRSIVIVDLVGLDNLTNAFGLCMMCQGVSTLMGLPIAGFLIETYNTYDVSFMFSGCVIITSGLLLLPVQYFKSKSYVNQKH